ncbi:MAG: PIN domain-containing protein [Candidatus Aenigmarchaeota archaeon]|nr:PIN domain-containing protein [Candidatus Aenigmarchaeota archaeon]
MSEIFFFDTYAFIETIRGNPKYESFESAAIITTIFNLAELNYILKKEMTKERADGYTQDYSVFLVEVTLEDIKTAMDFKTKNRKLSIPDAVGYIVAKKFGAKFVTGDGDFENLPNVEFIR